MTTKKKSNTHIDHLLQISPNLETEILEYAGSGVAVVCDTALTQVTLCFNLPGKKLSFYNSLICLDGKLIVACLTC